MLIYLKLNASAPSFEGSLETTAAVKAFQESSKVETETTFNLYLRKLSDSNQSRADIPLLFERMFSDKKALGQATEQDIELAVDHYINFLKSGGFGPKQDRFGHAGFDHLPLYDIVRCTIRQKIHRKKLVTIPFLPHIGEYSAMSPEEIFEDAWNKQAYLTAEALSHWDALQKQDSERPSKKPRLESASETTEECDEPPSPSFSASSSCGFPSASPLPEKTGEGQASAPSGIILTERTFNLPPPPPSPVPFPTTTVSSLSTSVSQASVLKPSSILGPIPTLKGIVISATSSRAKPPTSRIPVSSSKTQELADFCLSPDPKDFFKQLNERFQGDIPKNIIINLPKESYDKYVRFIDNCLEKSPSSGEKYHNCAFKGVFLAFYCYEGQRKKERLSDALKAFAEMLEIFNHGVNRKKAKTDFSL